MHPKSIPSLISTLSQNAFIRGGFIFSSASFAVSVLHYLFNLIIARGFSLADYGEYMSALSYVAILAVPFSALNVIVINRISKTKSAQRMSVAKGIERLAVHSLFEHRYLLLAITIILFGFFYLKTNLLTLSIFFILLSVGLNLFTVLYSSILQAYKAFLIAGLFALAAAVLKVLFGIVVVFMSSRLELLYVLLLSLNVLTVIIGSKLIFFRKKALVKTVTFSPVQTYLLKKQVVLPTLAMFGIIGMLNMDIIIVKKFFDAEQAGLYAGLSLLGKIILYASGPLSLVALTFFSGSDHGYSKKKILLFSLGLCAGIGLILSVGYALFSELIVTIVFGRKFLEITQYVWLTAIFGSMYALMSILAQYAISGLKYFSVYSLVALGAQVLGLYFFHSSFYDVLMVNILVMLGMNIVYGYFIITDGK